MSVQTEIDRIITAVGAAYDAVEAKGGTAPAAQTIEGIAGAIRAIPSGSAKEEQEKTVTITANGTLEITPDSGKTLSKVTAVVNVPQSGGGGPMSPEEMYEWIKSGGTALPDEQIEVTPPDSATKVYIGYKDQYGNAWTGMCVKGGYLASLLPNLGYNDCVVWDYNQGNDLNTAYVGDQYVNIGVAPGIPMYGAPSDYGETTGLVLTVATEGYYKFA